MYLFGSLLDLARFRIDSDIDLAVEGREPSEYWEAWRVVDETCRARTVDLGRLETATGSLQEVVQDEGEQLVGPSANGRPVGSASSLPGSSATGCSGG